MINQILGTIIEVLIIIILSEAAIMFGSVLYDDYFKKHEVRIVEVGIDEISDEELEKLKETFGDDDE